MINVRVALLPLFIVVGVVSVSADVSGTWKMNLISAVTQMPELACALSQKGIELSGNCRAAGATDGKSSELIDGRIENGIVRWQWKIVASDGESVTISLTGTPEAMETVMRGSFTVSSRVFTDEGRFTAAKQ